MSRWAAAVAVDPSVRTADLNAPVGPLPLAAGPEPIATGAPGLEGDPAGGGAAAGGRMFGPITGPGAVVGGAVVGGAVVGGAVVGGSVVGGAVVGGSVVGGSVVGGAVVGGSVVGGAVVGVSTASVVKVVSAAWPAGAGSSAPAPTWSNSTQTSAMTAALTAILKDDLCTVCTPRRLDHATRLTAPPRRASCSSFYLPVAARNGTDRQIAGTSV
jgi:hypothetical protein